MPILKMNTAEECIKFIEMHEDEIKSGTYDIEIERGVANAKNYNLLNFLSLYAPSSRESIANTRGLPEEIYSILAKVTDSCWKTLVDNQDTSTAVLEIINQRARRKSDEYSLGGLRNEYKKLFVSIVNHSNVSSTLLEELSEFDADFRYPKDYDRFYEIYSEDEAWQYTNNWSENRSEHEANVGSIRMAALYHPSCPHDAIRRAALSSSDEVKISLLQRLDLDNDTFGILAKSHSDWVREKVAKNPRTPRECLEILAKDANVNVRNAVYGNVRTPTSLKKQLSKDDGIREITSDKWKWTIKSYPKIIGWITGVSFLYIVESAIQVFEQFSILRTAGIVWLMVIMSVLVGISASYLARLSARGFSSIVAILFVLMGTGLYVNQVETRAEEKIIAQENALWKRKESLVGRIIDTFDFNYFVYGARQKAICDLYELGIVCRVKYISKYANGQWSGVWDRQELFDITIRFDSIRDFKQQNYRDGLWGFSYKAKDQNGTWNYRHLTPLITNNESWGYRKEVTEKISAAYEKWKNTKKTALTERYGLTVITTPSIAGIRILNIGPKYTDGIKLMRGRYQIEVSAPNYMTSTKWITIDASDHVEKITLRKKSS